jgi:hypothetical protein
VGERPRVDNRLPYNWILDVSCGALMHGDRTGPLGGKRRTACWKEQGRLLWEAGTSKDVASVWVN